MDLDLRRMDLDLRRMERALRRVEQLQRTLEEWLQRIAEGLLPGAQMSRGVRRSHGSWAGRGIGGKIRASDEAVLGIGLGCASIHQTRDRSAWNPQSREMAGLVNGPRGQDGSDFLPAR